MKIKKLFLIFTALCAVSFNFISCFNVMEENPFISLPEEPVSTGAAGVSGFTGPSHVKYATLQGSISFGGAVPSQLLAAINNENSGRTAMPQASSNWYYVLYATATGKTSPTPTVYPISSTSYSITGLETSASGVAWTVTVRVLEAASAEAAKNISATTAEASAILSDYCQINLTDDNSVYVHDFIVKPVTGSGKNGTLNLTMTVPESVTNVTVDSYTSAITINTPATPNPPTGAPKTVTITGTLASDSYSIRFNFYGTNNLLLYSNRQTINVFNNCVTNTWVNNGGTGNSDPISSGSYTVTDTMITNFQSNIFYVGATIFTNGLAKKTGTRAEGYTGTPVKPFTTIADAVSVIKDRNNSTADYTILITGSVLGTQVVGDSSTSSNYYIDGKAASIRIVGATGLDDSGVPQDELKLNDDTTGTILSVNTSVPVTIENLLITGGSNTNGNGGGIAITGGNVELTSGAVVNGNTAKVGGGVYLASGNLYLNGTAVVGKPLSALGANPACAGTTSGNYANKATEKGGGIAIQSGTLWLGYSSAATPAPVSTDGGVIYNLVYGSGETHGGGIDNAQGTIKFAKGIVAYNYARSTDTNSIGCGGGISNCNIMEMAADTNPNVYEKFITGNVAAYGGGIYLAKYTIPGTSNKIYGNLTMSGGSISYNQANEENGNVVGDGEGQGGGLAIGNNANFTIEGGTITNNTAWKSGGAVVHHGASFEIKGTTAKIPAGTNNANNILYWDDNRTIKVTGETASADHDIAITPHSWTRGLQLFHEDSTPAYFSKFKISDAEWKIVTHNSIGKLDADIWVASSGSDTGRASGVNPPPDSGRNGTPSKPYATIAEAVAQVWDTGSTKTLDFTINISGKITGNQTIANTVTNAKSITLLGDANATKKELNGGGSGTVLTISSTVLITIQNLTITGGNKTGDGGGINMQADNAKLTLTEGAVITANNSSGNGGGIYFGGASGKVGLLKMNSTASISGNTATGNGGGLYMSYANLCMSGTAMIGDTTASVAMSDAKSNSAANGGGVYCSDGQIWLGYSAASTNSTSELTAGYGVCRNYASGSGGGIYNHMSSFANNRSVVYLNTGSISFNQANSSSSSSNGGGIFNENSIHMSGGEIKGNYSYAGAGIYNTKPSGSNWVINVYFSGGIIGNYASTNAKPNSATNGAGVYNGSGCNLCMSGTAVIGYIDNSITSAATQDALKCANIAQNGSGVYNEGSIYFGYTGVGNNYKDNDFSGGIHYNFAQASGGGIYNKGTIQMHKGVISFNGTFGNGGGVYNDVTDDNKFLMNGGSIEKNETLSNGYGGALYLVNTTNTPFVLTGGAAIPSTGTKKKNDIYLDGSATIKVNDADYSPGTTTKNMWITPSVYSARQVVAGTETIVAKAFKYFYATKENTSDTVPKWAVNNSGNLFSAYVVSGASAVTPDKLTEGTDYTFVFPEDMTASGLAYAFQQLFGGAGEGAPTYDSIPTLGNGTVIDLSRLSITSFSTAPTFYSSDTKPQPISKVILPATLTADSFATGTIHYCFGLVAEFEVDSSAANIKCYNGAVYNSDYTKLLCYPGNTTSFSLHSSTTEIGDYACCSIVNANLNGITIPNTITKIGNSAFRYSTIRKITFPTNSNFTEIPKSCCDMCVYLNTVTIPSNVKTISERAFYHCVINSNIALPSGLLTIGPNAFERAFTSAANFELSVPSSVTKIGKAAFVDNTGTNFSVSLGSTTGWTKATEENGTYSTVNSTDVTWANLKTSSSLGGYWLKK